MEGVRQPWEAASSGGKGLRVAQIAIDGRGKKGSRCGRHGGRVRGGGGKKPLAAAI